MLPLSKHILWPLIDGCRRQKQSMCEDSASSASLNLHTCLKREAKAEWEQRSSSSICSSRCHCCCLSSLTSGGSSLPPRQRVCHPQRVKVVQVCDKMVLPLYVSLFSVQMHQFLHQRHIENRPVHVFMR